MKNQKRIFLAVSERGRHRGKVSFYIAEILPDKGLKLIDNFFTCQINPIKGLKNTVLSQLVERGELQLPIEDQNFNLIMVEGTGLNYVEQIKSELL